MGAERAVSVQLDGFERRLKGDEAGFSWCSSMGDRGRFGALVRRLIKLESPPARWFIPMSAISIVAAIGAPGTE